jgi:hypothetical protein
VCSHLVSFPGRLDVHRRVPDVFVDILTGELTDLFVLCMFM